MDERGGDGGAVDAQKLAGVINEKTKFGESEGKVPLDNIVKKADIYK